MRDSCDGWRYQPDEMLKDGKTIMVMLSSVALLWVIQQLNSYTEEETSIVGRYEYFILEIIENGIYGEVS